MDEDDQRKRLLRQRRPGQRVGGHEEPVIGKELAWRLLLDAGYPAKEGFAAAGAAGWLLQWGVPESIGHYDLLISAALTGRLDQFDRRPRMARENGSGEVRS
jgi:hypothetical protein